MYRFSGVSAESSRQTLTNLSFFIAHSLFEQHHVHAPFSPGEIEALEAVPVPQREDGGKRAGQGDNCPSHRRSDREATVGGKKGMGGLTLKTICFLIADMFGCIGGMSLLFPLAIA